ncbi:hypothetical protein [Corallococcus sp. RDP092CA]|uniref:hypothetical protein n=1 Tax=Corallococcus sp. RDP092CA TaxID=3109369 RepID=UPI0035B4B2E9
MSPQPAVSLLPWLPPALLLGVWTFVSFTLSRLGGWARLARDYRPRGGGGLPRSAFITGAVGAVEHRACPRGRCLAVLLPFRLGHPPRCIPWSDVHDRVRERRFFLPWDTFKVGPDGVKPRLRSNALTRLDGALPPVPQA